MCGSALLPSSSWPAARPSIKTDGHEPVAIGEAPHLAVQLEAIAQPDAVVIAASTRQGSALAGAISDALGGLLLEARERVAARLCSFSPTPTELSAAGKGGRRGGDQPFRC